MKKWIVCLVLALCLSCMTLCAFAATPKPDLTPDVMKFDYSFQVQEQFVLLIYSAPKESGRMVLYSPTGTFSGTVDLPRSAAGGKCTVKVQTLNQGSLLYGTCEIPADPSYTKPKGSARGHVRDIVLTGTPEGFDYSFTAEGTDFILMYYRNAQQNGYIEVFPVDDAGHYQGSVALPLAYARAKITVQFCNERGVAMKEQAVQKGYTIPEPAEQQPGRLSGVVVCVDPGHQENGHLVDEPIGPGLSGTTRGTGGSAQGCYTLRLENIVTLEIGFRLRDELLRQGATVVMTREDQTTFHTNIERDDIANDAGAFIMLRLHGNARDNRSIYGIQVYGPRNSAYAQALTTKENYTAMGELLLNSMKEAVGYKQVKQTGQVQLNDTYVGNNWAKMYCFLVEMGYMTNVREDLLLSTPVYQEWLAKGMAEGIYRIAQAEGLVE